MVSIKTPQAAYPQGRAARGGDIMPKPVPEPMSFGSGIKTHLAAGRFHHKNSD